MTEAQDAEVMQTDVADIHGTDPLRVEAPVHPTNGTQECEECHVTKPLDAFYITTHTLKDGTTAEYRRKRCKKCVDKATYARKMAQGRPSRAKPREVPADNRTGGRKSGAGTDAGAGGGAGDYHFDVRFVRRLARIARVLQREGWRSLDALSAVDNQQLGAAGIAAGDVQILRKAQSKQDARMLRYILHEPIAAPPPATFPNGPQVPAGAGEDESVAQAGIEAEPAGPITLSGLTERAEHGLSDDDIEAAAHMLVNVRTRIAELNEVVREYEDRLESLRRQLADAQDERSVAINLLRQV